MRLQRLARRWRHRQKKCGGENDGACDGEVGAACAGHPNEGSASHRAGDQTEGRSKPFPCHCIINMFVADEVMDHGSARRHIDDPTETSEHHVEIQNP